MDSVSNSEIKCFKRCRRKWWLTYYRQLQPMSTAGDAIGPRGIGNRVHACLAAFYEPGSLDVAVAMSVHEALVKDDLARLEASGGDLAKYTKEADLSCAMLAGYFEWLEDEGVDEGLTVAGVETELQAELPITLARSVTIRGKLDKRVVRDRDGARLFLDHKTVQEFTTPSRVLHLDEQFLMYELLETLNGIAEDDRCDGGLYNMLRKVKRTAGAKPPFYMRLEIRHNIHELRAFYDRLRAELLDMYELREQLDAGRTEAAYPNPTRDCSWDCDFFAVCGLLNDPSSDAEFVIGNAYRVGDPYARYGDATMKETIE